MGNAPFSIIADCFRSGTVVPFLGAAASFVGAAPQDALPSGPALSSLLASLGAYPGPPSDPLTKVAQFIEETQAGRGYLLEVIASQFAAVHQEYHSSVTDFLGSLPAALVPRLILTTNYDALVENSLQRRSIPCLTISHVMRGSRFAGRFFCCEPLASAIEDRAKVRTLKELRSYLVELEARAPNNVVVYKMHGTAQAKIGSSQVDSVVLTENDYIEFFALDLLNKIPEQIVDRLSRGHLLFLGYSLEDWNFRVLLRKIKRIQELADVDHRHWAFLLNATEVEAKFWDKRNVNVYQQSIDASLAALLELLKRGAAA